MTLLRAYSTPILLVGYFIAAIIFGGGFSGGNELFPFFSWSLFSYIPNIRNEFTVRIYEYHGKTFNPPIFFSEAQNIVSNSSSIVARQLIQTLGNNIIQGDESEVRKTETLFETNYLSAPVKYEIVHLTYDPIGRWQTGISTIKNIRIFKIIGTLQ